MKRQANCLKTTSVLCVGISVVLLAFIFPPLLDAHRSPLYDREMLAILAGDGCNERCLYSESTHYNTGACTTSHVDVGMTTSSWALCTQSNQYTCSTSIDYGTWEKSWATYEIWATTSSTDGFGGTVYYCTSTKLGSGGSLPGRKVCKFD